jgi:hypothetical protein
MGRVEMKTRITRRRATLALALAVAAAAIAIPAVVGLASASNERSQAAVAASATARYHDVARAEAAGYGLFRDAAGIACIDNPGVGAMGIHYVNGTLVGDGNIDATKPEALVYAPAANGKLKLAALEYIVFVDNWPGGLMSRPSLFGHPFNFTPSPNRYGIPAFYSLHSWIWQPNSAGLLEPWNPRVHC